MPQEKMPLTPEQMSHDDKARALLFATSAMNATARMSLENNGSRRHSNQELVNRLAEDKARLAQALQWLFDSLLDDVVSKVEIESDARKY